jgi:hypothetical protein
VCLQLQSGFVNRPLTTAKRRRGRRARMRDLRGWTGGFRHG